MNKMIVHLSDFHFRQNWEEDQDVVLAEFFKDLGKQISELDRSSVYIAFSGDFVRAGGTSDLFNKFLNQFDDEFNKLEIPKSQRICVPGNHDIAQDFVSSNFVDHEGVVSQKLSEYDFNDYISKDDNIFTKKFANYKLFESRFADKGGSSQSMSGAGWDIDENIAIYCLNSALCSSGGLIKNGKAIIDKGRLSINTRELQKWNLNCKARTKILIMHHPIEWLVYWAQVELNKILKNSFSLCLAGHTHDQDMFHLINNGSSLVTCSAPPLLTNKDGDLGYSMIKIGSNEGVIDIVYRQWTKHRSFVSGVNFSNTDNGMVSIKDPTVKSVEIVTQQNKSTHGLVGRYLTRAIAKSRIKHLQQEIGVHTTKHSFCLGTTFFGFVLSQ